MKDLLGFTLQQQEGHLSRAADEDTPAAGAASTSPRTEAKAPVVLSGCGLTTGATFSSYPLRGKGRQERKGRQSTLMLALNPGAGEKSHTTSCPRLPLKQHNTSPF